MTTTNFLLPEEELKRVENWEHMIFGIYPLAEVKRCVKDSAWQKRRIAMLGVTLRAKYMLLEDWLDRCGQSHESKVQVTNYIYALKRGGLLK